MTIVLRPTLADSISRILSRIVFFQRLIVISLLLFFRRFIYFYKYVMSDLKMTIAKVFKKEKSSKHIITREPPSRLINPTLYIINFAERKFLNIGLDPANNFNVAIHIITPSRHLSMLPETLERIFALMGDILSVLVDVRLKTKTPVFLVDDTMRLSKITCRGENKLAFQSISDGNKVLLSRGDIIALQNMKWGTFESVILKINVIKPVVLRQLEQMTAYLKSISPHTFTLEDMMSVIREVSDESLASHVPNEEACFVSQLKLYAEKQIVEKWTLAIHDKPIKVEPLSSPLSPSPENPVENLYQYPSQDCNVPGVYDENDGPSKFNRYPPPPPTSPTFAIYPSTTGAIDGGHWWGY